MTTTFKTLRDLIDAGHVEEMRFIGADEDGGPLMDSDGVFDDPEWYKIVDMIEDDGDRIALLWNTRAEVYDVLVSDDTGTRIYRDALGAPEGTTYGWAPVGPSYRVEDRPRLVALS